MNYEGVCSEFLTLISMNLPLISQKNTLFDNLLFNDLLFAEINVQYKSRLASGFFRVVSSDDKGTAFLPNTQIFLQKVCISRKI